MRHPLTSTLAVAAALFALPAHAADQARSLAPFTSVSNSGPVNLHIEVGKPQSVVVTGSDDYLADLRTEVVGGELRIHLRNGGTINDRHWDDMKMTITVPRLTALAMSGAGQTTLTHISGDALDISFSGAGSLKADGTVGKLTLDVSGVGSIDTRELHADIAHVNVSGVGSVKVWAGQRLDGNVSGVGSLTYYGDPKTVDTSGGGLGSVTKGR
jgi:hypothetical protein